MNRWKELLVDREGDVVGRLQEAVSEKKDNAIVMRRSDAKIVKENIEMMVSLDLEEHECHLETWTSQFSPQLELAANSESDRATSAWIENQNWSEFAKEVQKLEESLMKREADINAAQMAANQYRQQQ